jgi:rare lipoprotein A
MPFSLKRLLQSVVVVILFASGVEIAAAETGRASWYSLRSLTASGERCNPNALTAAHRSLPFGTKVRVENLKNGKSVIVRINDRGPFVGGRIIDLTKAAASRLGMVNSGVGHVRLTVVGST